jgi:hypothetical protein
MIPAARKAIGPRTILLMWISNPPMILPIRRTGCGSQQGSPSAASSAQATINSVAVTMT